MHRKAIRMVPMGVILAGVLFFGVVVVTWGHGVNDLPLDKYQSGQLTANSDRSVRIDGREYSLDKKVALEDDEGRPKQIQDFKAGMYVRYILKNDRVRELILVTPK